MTFDGEVILFVYSASEFQKKDRSVMGFICGVTGDEFHGRDDLKQFDLLNQSFLRRN